jgi:hypothetical protein
LEGLSVDDCRYLLQNYLLSLVMCDGSFPITVCSGSATDTLLEDHTTKEKAFTVISRQLQDKPGMIVYGGDALTWIERGVYLYEVKVIDCKRKPAKKLRLRQEEEEPQEEPLGLATMELLKESARATACQ